MPSPVITKNMNLRGSFYYMGRQRDLGSICKKGLHRLFDMPCNTNKIVFKAYTRAVPNTKMIRFRRNIIWSSILCSMALCWTAKTGSRPRAEVAIGLAALLEKHFPELKKDEERTLWIAIAPQGRGLPHFKPK